MAKFLHMLWEGTRHPLVLLVAGFVLTNIRSMIEHWFNRSETKAVQLTLTEIHGKLNGGLDALIQEKVDKAMEERR